MLLLKPTTTSKALEQFVGNLGYAACVEPFRRPLLTFLAHQIKNDDPNAVITISPLMKAALRIWFAMLRCNRGLPYAYTRGHLPKASAPVFVDAASLVGLGGLHGTDYFMIAHENIQELLQR